MSGYCTRADVLAFLPSGGLPNAAREATGNAGGDYVACEQHNLVDDDAVQFYASTDGSLPAPLVEGTTYYVIVVSTSRFQVSATEGGALIPLTTAGENFQFRAELPWDGWIDAAARDVDSFLPVHVVPVETPYPQVLVTANAELAAARGLLATGGAILDLGTKLDAVGARLTRWAKAIPLRGSSRSVTSPVNLALVGSASTDPRGWDGDDSTRIP
jgi:hypothetical protein